MRYRFFYLTFVLIGIFCINNNFTYAKDVKKSDHNYVRIFYYQEGKNSRESFNKNLDSIDVIAPQTYKFDSYGNLVGGVKSDIIETAQKRNIKVMPLVTNGAFTQASFKTLLDNEEKQKRAIKYLVDEAKKNNYWGWQLDFEQMDLSYRDKFSAFSKRFGEEMKKAGLSSSVAVIAQISEKPEDYPKNLWQRIIGVYDYSSLSKSVDFLSIMSYDDPESKGPVARYTWMKKVLEHTMSIVPKEKISLGIPLYYWKWDDARGKLVDIGGYKSMKTTLDKYKVTKGYSISEQVPFIKYKTKGKQYTIWYEDNRSVSKKLDLVIDNKLHGFSAWALGLETPDIHKAISEKAPNKSLFTFKSTPF